MIYNSESIYKNFKTELQIHGEEEFLNLIQNNDSSISDDMLQSAFKDFRLMLGQNFKLDNICFLIGNGCSLYAGAKSTLQFNIKEAVAPNDYNSISDVVEIIGDKPLEEQLNDLLTIQEYFRIINDGRKETVDKLINNLKGYLLKNYANVQYKALNYHEAMLRKLRSFGCLSKVQFYTPNYDLAIEYSLDKLSIEYANGFSGFVNRKFDPKSFQNCKTTKLIKIHGSINWLFDEEEKVIKEVQPDNLDDYLPPDTEHVLIYPTAQKLYETYNAPYSELMRSMLNVFESNRNVVIVLGYKYGDEHINEILSKAVANPNNIFYFFDYDGGKCDFIKRMISLSKSTKNINIILGEYLADFRTFVDYMLPANAEQTDEEKIFELLNKVMDKNEVEEHAE